MLLLTYDIISTCDDIISTLDDIYNVIYNCIEAHYIQSQQQRKADETIKTYAGITQTENMKVWMLNPSTVIDFCWNHYKWIL